MSEMATRAARLEAALRQAFSPVLVRVVDDSARHAGHAGARPEGETHFTVTVVADGFAGKSRVERQRLVYDILKDELASRVHALSLTTLTPGEAASRRERGPNRA